MSRFSNKLKELFAVKDVDKMKVAGALNIDRALLYRYLNDQSFPADEKFIEDLQRELFLTPFEYKELREAYEMTRLGDDICNNRELVRGIINTIYYSNAAPAETCAIGTTLMSNEKIRVVNDSDEVFSALTEMVTDPRTDKIWMSLQPDREFVTQAMLPLINRQAALRKLRVEHLLRFQSKTGDAPGVYNLKIFSQLLPSLYYCNYCTTSDYFAYFYYNNQAAVDERAMDLYPNILITPWCTCLMKCDYTGAIMMCDEATAMAYQRCFMEIEHMATPFVIDTKQSNPSVWLHERLKDAHYSEYIFKSHPSVQLGITKDFYERYPLGSNPDSIAVQDYQETYRLRNEMLYSPLHDSRTDYFSAAGLHALIQDGYFSTRYASSANPLPKQAICEYLETYIAAIKKNPHFNTHLIRADKPNSKTSDFSIYLLDDNILYIENPNRKNVSTYVIQVTERSIIDAFTEYLQNGLPGEDCISSTEETLAYLSEQLEELRTEENIES